MIRLIIFICIFVSPVFSQQDNAKKQANQTEGEKIIQKAWQAIGLDQTAVVSSYFYKSKTTINELSNYESFDEISLELPDKIQAVYSSKGLLSSQSPFSGQLIRTWDNKKYKSIFESDLAGKRTVKDTTNEENRTISKAVSDVIGKKTAAALENSRKADPKIIFTESLWTSLFPLILSHPFEKNIEFKYVGKAKSGDTMANVIDVKPANGRTYRLLFDSETDYLLMMIVSEKVKNDRFVGDVEEKYYFSERELTDGLLIPKKIKIEKKATPEGELPVVKFFNVDIVDFKLNPKFDEKIFEIK